VALNIDPVATDDVHVIGMVAVSTMFPLLVAVKAAGLGLAVQTVEALAEAGETARPTAAAPAPATIAILVRDFFMALGLSLWIDRQRGAVAEPTKRENGRPADRENPTASIDVTCGKLFRTMPSTMIL
jgi:hypothetical protein